MCKFRNKRWGKHYNKKRNWPKYNNQLVIRGEFYLDLEFSEHWDDELREMNKGKGVYRNFQIVLLSGWQCGIS